MRCTQGTYFQDILIVANSKWLLMAFNQLKEEEDKPWVEHLQITSKDFGK
jgi:hypothetical protein